MNSTATGIAIVVVFLAIIIAIFLVVGAKASGASKAMIVCAVFFFAIAVIFGFWVATEYPNIDYELLEEIVEKPYEHYGETATSPNVLLGIAVASVFLFFGVVCAALVPIVDNAVEKRKEYQEDSEKFTNEEQDASEQYASSIVVSLQQGKDGFFYCPHCGIRQEKRRPNCPHCGVKFRE